MIDTETNKIEIGLEKAKQTVEKRARELHIVFTKKAGAYLSPGLAKALLKKLGLDEGEMAVTAEDLPQESANEVIVKLRLRKSNQKPTTDESQ